MNMATFELHSIYEVCCFFFQCYYFGLTLFQEKSQTFVMYIGHSKT